ncbi:MAG: hypothetical protein RLZZ333_662, partial [Bacteroidota bacterium]
MAKANEIKYLTAIKTEQPKKKFCRFKKYGIRYIDYKDAEFLKKFAKEKGYKMCLNVMDNQASNVVKKYLHTKGCQNMVVEPNNHRVNAAERAIQTFKAHFISALATTDKDFPLQLWDCLTPQVTTTLNMLRPSRKDPCMSAYEAIYGPYDWNRYPLAPLGCKAVIYENGDTRGSWASRGVNGWYLGP